MKLPSFRLPPPTARSFRSNAVDEIVEFVSREDGTHSRVIHGSGQLAYERHVVAGHDVALGWSRLTQSQTLRAAVQQPVLQIAIDSANSYAFGRRRVHVVPGAAMFVAPGWEFTRWSEPGGMFALGLSTQTLCAEIDARRPGSGEWTAQSRPVDLAASDRTFLEAAIAELAIASDSTAAARQHALCEARVISVMAELLSRGSAVSRARPLTASRLAALEAWIDAHLGEPLTLGRLCQAADVGERTLQLTFRSLRGVSPMRFVTDRRLAATRRHLMRAGAGGEVTGIAIEAGFSHLGRFAMLYRQAYGESPSETLRG